MKKVQRGKYIFESKSGALLELWPSGSREIYLSSPYLPKKFLGRGNVQAPRPLPFDILGSYGIINAARTVHDKSYYCSYFNKGFVSILITTRGEADIRINDKSHTLKSGSAFVSDAGVETRGIVKKNWHVLWFHLDLSWRPRSEKAVLIENADTAEILHCADVYLKEVFKPRRSLRLLDLCAQTLVFRLRRLLSPDSYALEKLDEVFEAARLNPAAATSAKSTAKRLSISVYELDKLSLSLCGAKFKKAVSDIRMEAARAMICKKLPLEKVAKAVGFADQSAFSKAFKRFHKISPSRFAE